MDRPTKQRKSFIRVRGVWIRFGGQGSRLQRLDRLAGIGVRLRSFEVLPGTLRRNVAVAVV